VRKDRDENLKKKYFKLNASFVFKVDGVSFFVISLQWGCNPKVLFFTLLIGKTNANIS